MDGWIPCENAKRILCPDTKIPHCKSRHAGHVEPISPLIFLSVKMWPCPVARDVIVSCCAHCDLIMLCTPQGREIIWASVYFSWQFSSLKFCYWSTGSHGDCILLRIHSDVPSIFKLIWCSIFKYLPHKKTLGWELSCLSQVLQFPWVLCYYYTCFEYRSRSLWKIFTSSQVVLCKQQILLEYETNVHVV